ncbi:hypothetical protein L1887_23820 [Cichorium endivia]|nr:hypothetical protein L1887_23820 [Cichorium endivia]
MSILSNLRELQSSNPSVVAVGPSTVAAKPIAAGEANRPPPGQSPSPPQEGLKLQEGLEGFENFAFSTVDHR